MLLNINLNSNLKIPDDILKLIFDYSDIKDLNNIIITSKLFFNINEKKINDIKKILNFHDLCCNEFKDIIGNYRKSHIRVLKDYYKEKFYRFNHYVLVKSIFNHNRIIIKKFNNIKLKYKKDKENKIAYYYVNDNINVLLFKKIYKKSKI